MPPGQPLDTPTQRYRRQRALGATHELALSVVASSYGLSHNIVKLSPDGSEKQLDPNWTLPQLEHLHFYRWLFGPTTTMSGRAGDDR